MNVLYFDKVRHIRKKGLIKEKDDSLNSSPTFLTLTGRRLARHPRDLMRYELNDPYVLIQFQSSDWLTSYGR